MGLAAQLKKDWTSAVYVFFHSKLKIEYMGHYMSHIFKCQGKGCKTTICQFLDTKDVKSIGNMHKHVIACSCWGKMVLVAADDAANEDEVHTKIVDGILKNGSITEAFERKGKGKRTYLNWPLTHAKIKAKIIKWVCIFIWPFDVVSDEPFHYLMKSGWPNMYVPSPLTASQDVWLVFTRCCTRLGMVVLCNVLVAYSVFFVLRNNFIRPSGCLLYSLYFGRGSGLLDPRWQSVDC